MPAGSLKARRATLTTDDTARAAAAAAQATANAAVPNTAGGLAAALSAGLVPDARTAAVPRSVATRIADVVNVLDFGAIGDDTLHTVAEWIGAGKTYANLAALQAVMPWVTDTGYSVDTAAFNMAGEVARKKGGLLASLGAAVRLVTPGGKRYHHNHPVFWGTDRDGSGTATTSHPFAASQTGFILDFDCQDAVNYCAMAASGKVAFDFSGIRFTTIRALNVVGDATNPPLVGILLARGGLTNPAVATTGKSSDNIRLDACFTDGAFDLCGYYEYAAEDVYRTALCWFRITGTTGTACAILSRRNVENVPLDFQTNVPAGAQTTYIGGGAEKNYYYNAMTGGSPAAGMACLIIDECASHVEDNAFFTYETLTSRPHVRMLGADDVAGAPVRIKIRNCHHHGAYTNGLQVENSTVELEYTPRLVGSAGSGVALQVASNKSIFDSGPIRCNKIQQVGASGSIERSDLFINSTAGSLACDGKLTGVVVAPSAVVPTVTTTAAYLRVENDTGCQYSVDSSLSKSTSFSILQAHNNKVLTMTAGTTINLSAQTAYTVPFYTTVINTSGSDVTITPTTGTNTALPTGYAATVVKAASTLYVYVGPPATTAT